MGNYRPISILPVFSKALEKAILQKMSVFEGKHKLLSDSQFGFRKGFSTELALLTQKEHILSQLEDEKLVFGLYIDFSKAFDTINHELLIRKLEHYGIQGKAGALMEYYLKHRTQIVALDERERESSLLDESREVCRHVTACMLLCGDGEKGVKALKEVGQKKDGKRRD